MYHTPHNYVNPQIDFWSFFLLCIKRSARFSSWKVCIPECRTNGERFVESNLLPGGQARELGQIGNNLRCLMFDRMASLLQSRPSPTWEDISREIEGSGHLTVRRSKTGPEWKGKVLWINPESMDALTANQWESDIDSDLVFGLSGKQTIRHNSAACEAAGLGKGFSRDRSRRPFRYRPSRPTLPSLRGSLHATRKLPQNGECLRDLCVPSLQVSRGVVVSEGIHVSMLSTACTPCASSAFSFSFMRRPAAAH